ncbi:MAG: hypothetical protein U5L03_17610 [Burkholderiaceae bacterium]|nr:hypothetical protein [Burkholderiaceae bacterium]
MDKRPELRKTSGLSEPAFEIWLFLVEVLNLLDLLISWSDDWHEDLWKNVGASFQRPVMSLVCTAAPIRPA